MFIPKSTSPLNTWLNYIQFLHFKSIDLDLTRVCYVANKLNLLHPAQYIITVGGTNGKGTVCRLLEIILLAMKIKVGVYSSPHLLRYTERVRINGQELPENIHSISMDVIESGRDAISLSYFEFSTLSALQLFKQELVEIIILEVGLGGRLDATNIVNPNISIITNIALDHTNFLGTDRTSIAKEKAGIFRYGKPAVIGEDKRPITLDIAIKKCGAILYAYKHDWWFSLKENSYWCWWDRKDILKLLPIPNIPLINAATTVAALHCLPFTVPEVVIHQGLNGVSLPGRFQIIGKNPLMILDVAHNPHAARYVANCLLKLKLRGTIRIVIGMLADKDISGTLACFDNLLTTWYCVSLKVGRGASAMQIAKHLNYTVQRFIFENVLDAWNQAIDDSNSEDCVLALGSFHTIAPIMSFIIENK